MPERYQSWLSQAENDLAWGQSSLKDKFFAQACFIAQQVSEKALKSLAYYRGYDKAKSHSILQLARELSLNSEIERAARQLDLYYISTRYPDAIPDSGIPAEHFSKEQAEQALDWAAMIIDKVKSDEANVSSHS